MEVRADRVPWCLVSEVEKLYESFFRGCVSYAFLALEVLGYMTPWGGDAAAAWNRLAHAIACWPRTLGDAGVVVHGRRVPEPMASAAQSPRLEMGGPGCPGVGHRHASRIGGLYNKDPPPRPLPLGESPGPAPPDLPAD